MGLIRELLHLITLTATSGDKFIRIKPSAIEAIFEGAGERKSMVFEEKIFHHGATIFLSCGKEVDVLETPEDIKLKIKDHDSIEY